MNLIDSSPNIPMFDRGGSAQTATLHTKGALNLYPPACVGHDVISPLGRGGGFRWGGGASNRKEGLHTGRRGFIQGGGASYREEGLYTGRVGYRLGFYDNSAKSILLKRIRCLNSA